ncbi:MAG TPA: AraC family transcriptional regulator, partial [Rhodospirillaceae bacterium]|nr:AraC family transcriptional regulator [Rhodospirillaceae bacterium]
QNVFKDVYGMSPMAYLRLVRLKRVHSALRNGGEDGATIAQIARAWGFGHMGRFAEIYRHQFGELPSETVRKRV